MAPQSSENPSRRSPLTLKLKLPQIIMAQQSCCKIPLKKLRLRKYAWEMWTVECREVTNYKLSIKHRTAEFYILETKNVDIDDSSLSSSSSSLQPRSNSSTICSSPFICSGTISSSPSIIIGSERQLERSKCVHELSGNSVTREVISIRDISPTNPPQPLLTPTNEDPEPLQEFDTEPSSPSSTTSTSTSSNEEIQEQIQKERLLFRKLQEIREKYKRRRFHLGFLKQQEFYKTFFLQHGLKWYFSPEGFIIPKKITTPAVIRTEESSDYNENEEISEDNHDGSITSENEFDKMEQPLSIISPLQNDNLCTSDQPCTSSILNDPDVLIVTVEDYDMLPSPSL